MTPPETAARDVFRGLTQADLALVFWSITRRGSAVHDDVVADYDALADSAPGGRRRTPMWIYAALDELIILGLIEVDPIAGRSHRGHKARSWRLKARNDAPAVAPTPRRGTTEWLSPADVCELVPGVSLRQLQHWRNEGRGPKYSKAGRTVVYDKRQVDAWLQSTSVSPRDRDSTT